MPPFSTIPNAPSSTTRQSSSLKSAERAAFAAFKPNVLAGAISGHGGGINGSSNSHLKKRPPVGSAAFAQPSVATTAHKPPRSANNTSSNPAGISAIADERLLIEHILRTGEANDIVLVGALKWCHTQLKTPSPDPWVLRSTLHILALALSLRCKQSTTTTTTSVKTEKPIWVDVGIDTAEILRGHSRFLSDSDVAQCDQCYRQLRALLRGVAIGSGPDLNGSFCKTKFPRHKPNGNSDTSALDISGIRSPYSTRGESPVANIQLFPQRMDWTLATPREGQNAAPSQSSTTEVTVETSHLSSVLPVSSSVADQLPPPMLSSCSPCSSCLPASVLESPAPSSQSSFAIEPSELCGFIFTPRVDVSPSPACACRQLPFNAQTPLHGHVLIHATPSQSQSQPHHNSAPRSCSAPSPDASILSDISTSLPLAPESKIPRLAPTPRAPTPTDLSTLSAAPSSSGAPSDSGGSSASTLPTKPQSNPKPSNTEDRSHDRKRSIVSNATTTSGGSEVARAPRGGNKGSVAASRKQASADERNDVESTRKAQPLVMSSFPSAILQPSTLPCIPHTPSMNAVDSSICSVKKGNRSGSISLTKAEHTPRQFASAATRSTTPRAYQIASVPATPPTAVAAGPVPTTIRGNSPARRGSQTAAVASRTRNGTGNSNTTPVQKPRGTAARPSPSPGLQPATATGKKAQFRVQSLPVMTCASSVSAAPTKEPTQPIPAFDPSVACSEIDRLTEVMGDVETKCALLKAEREEVEQLSEQRLECINTLSSNKEWFEARIATLEGELRSHKAKLTNLEENVASKDALALVAQKQKNREIEQLKTELAALVQSTDEITFEMEFTHSQLEQQENLAIRIGEFATAIVEMPLFSSPCAVQEPERPALSQVDHDGQKWLDQLSQILSSSRVITEACAVLNEQNYCSPMMACAPSTGSDAKNGTVSAQLDGRLDELEALLARMVTKADTARQQLAAVLDMAKQPSPPPL